MDVTLNCDDSDSLLAAAALGPLPAEEHAALHLHLDSCDRCRRAGAVYLATAEWLALAAPVMEPPASLRQGLMAEVRADAPRAGAEGARSWRPMGVGGRLRRRGIDLRGLGLLGGGLATGAVAAVAVAGLLTRGGTDRAPTPAPVAYAVSATTAQPLVKGWLMYDPASKRGVVDVEGLIQPPAGGSQQAPETYELWLIRADGATIPAGYLGLQPDGRTWSTAVVADLRQYHSASATLERPGGSATPQGQTIFTVPLTPPA